MEFDEIFVRSNRPVAVPRPGLKLAHRWPLARASALSRGDALLREVRAALDEALAAFGARPDGALPLLRLVAVGDGDQTRRRPETSRSGKTGAKNTDCASSLSAAGSSATRSSSRRSGETRHSSARSA